MTSDDKDYVRRAHRSECEWRWEHLATGVGQYVLYSCVALNDEASDDCDELVPIIIYRLEVFNEWVQRLEDRGVWGVTMGFPSAREGQYSQQTTDDDLADFSRT